MRGRGPVGEGSRSSAGLSGRAEVPIQPGAADAHPVRRSVNPRWVPPTVHRIHTLPAAAGAFGRRLTPRLLAGQLFVAMVARVAWGAWSWRDLSVVGVLVGLQPFTEWVIHAFVLHGPANGGVRDRLAGDSHRRHHHDPRDLRHQFIDPRAVYLGMLLNAGIVAAFRTPVTLTVVVTVTGLTLAYEWVHFLIHTDYSPRHELYRQLYRAHRWHHYRNEKYWLGVTGRTGDRLLRTSPRRDDVEVSATAKTALATR